MVHDIIFNRLHVPSSIINDCLIGKLTEIALIMTCDNQFDRNVKINWCNEEQSLLS